ncbi:MAG: CysS/YqeB C-terminal domain-containing protein [Acidimicrobiales bacterium]
MGSLRLPRLLTIMGSGETAPTMVKVHRAVLDRLAEASGGGGGPVPAVVLDTPYGFQENADELSARTVEYFRQSVGYPLEVVNFRSAADDPVRRERAMAQLRDAAYVFAGPGSPTYALAQWAGSPVPELLAAKLAAGGPGGGVTFASAAALTLGVATVPVYEIYKAGVPPAWTTGLDLLSVAGLRAAVIPHYDNAEGGTHDTRYCYLGERRLRWIEPDLPDGSFVLGVDEHTACVIDLDAASVTVEGRGAVHVRRDGVTQSFSSGTTMAIADLLEPGATPAGSESAGHGEAGGSADVQVERGDGAEPAAGLLAEATRQHDAFGAGVNAGDLDGAVAAVLATEQAMVDWSADTLQSDEPDRARALLREMVVRLGDLARTGTRDPREVVAPFVEAVLDARVQARAAGDWSAADALRDRLVAAGVEVRDTPDGVEWDLRESTLSDGGGH